MSNNATAGLQFKAKVLNVLLRQGLVGAYDPYEMNRLSDAIPVGLTTDIGGIEPWSIDVRATRTRQFSAGLEDAAARARLLGTDWFVTVQPRRDRPASEAYAVLPLRLLARLMAGETPALHDVSVADLP